MSESMQAWIFLIGLIVFFIVLLIVTLVVLFGGGKDKEPEFKKSEQKITEQKKNEQKQPEQKKSEQKQAEQKKTESKKTESKKSDSKKSVTGKEAAKAEKKQPVEEDHKDYSYDDDQSYDQDHDKEYDQNYDQGYDDHYDDQDKAYDSHDDAQEDEYYDEYEDYTEAPDDMSDKEDLHTGSEEVPETEPAEETVIEEEPVEEHRSKKKKKDKNKEQAQVPSDDDIFSIPMDEESIISRIEESGTDVEEEEEKPEDEVPKENYWYNKEEVADRPSYRKPEDYYHYFRSAFDSLDDLLTEMYDCAYVKIEEIRFIAYGIEPKTIFGNEDLLADEDAFIEKFKTKNPSMQDGVKIYEKWCGYVDRFLKIIEFHVSDEMKEDIKKKLCEYGKSDAKTLINGR